MSSLVGNAAATPVLGWAEKDINCGSRNTQLSVDKNRILLEDFLNPSTFCQSSSSSFLNMVAGSLYLPKDDPKKPRGEDAHFVFKHTIGVADGVGGWVKEGIDGGEYARQLITNSILALRNEPSRGVNPKRVLQEAYKNTNVEGSSTACIVTLSGNRLIAANVGDSGFLVMRNGNAIFRSPTQQRSFNCPFQLGKSRDDPTVAQEIEVFVEDGDFVVVGSDGLFDNVHVGEIEEVVRRSTTRGQGLEEMACQMANLALYNSFDRFADTPYAMAARRAGKRHQRGGKIDDITVVIARILS